MQSAHLHQQEVLQTVLRYRVVLVRSGLLITHDYHAAEDIYQNMVIKSLDTDLTFASVSSLLVWCRKVVRTEGIEWLKKHGREIALDDSRLLDMMDAESMDELKESQYFAARAELLDDCLKKLSSESQRILSLRYGSDRSCAEVASVMEISLDSVYKRLSRIHLALRDCVNTKVIGSTLREKLSNGS